MVSCVENSFQHNYTVVSVIPNCEPKGNLPPGIWEVTWDEFAIRYGRTDYRKKLLNGLLQGLYLLRDAGCQTAYVDGSFITDKEGIYNEQPSDFDVCYPLNEADPDILDSIFDDLTAGRAAHKKRFLGEFLPSDALADKYGNTFLEYFQQDMKTGKAKGIIRVDLNSLPRREMS